MKVFGYCPEGLKQSVLSENISMEELVRIIKNHPEEGLISTLRSSLYKSDRYTAIKKMLPYVTPHATFTGSRKKENVKKYSGYFFLDVDKGNLPAGTEVMKEHILKHHGDKISLLGQSVGGQGLFFYVLLANPEVLTKENFDDIYNYIRCSLFSDIPTDGNAGGVNRVHIIPYDTGLYTNLEAKVIIPDSLLNGKKLLTRGIKDTNTICCTPAEKFLDIRVVLQMLNLSTKVDVGNLDVLVKDVLCCKVFFPEVIPDGRKHTVFRGMVNCIMHNNPGIELMVILSFINYINTHYTDGKPMALYEMRKTVEAEYNRILKTGKIYGLKNKRYHSNPKDDRITRIRNVARKRGQEKRERSIQLIKGAVEQLKVESADRITIKKIAKHLEGQLSEATINRYWREVVPKRIIN